MLETAPSLSIYAKNTIDGVEDPNNGLEEQPKHVINGDFSFVKEDHLDLVNKEQDYDDLGHPEKFRGSQVGEEPASPPMFLATGLGINDVPQDFTIEKADCEDYYMDLLEEYPNHPLVLKYYAQFLQRKGDLQGAEDYYFRAMKVEPTDGEILSQYALLVWELHHDQERASAFFELAAQTAPKDSNVLAAYAKFLWEIDDDGDDYSNHPDHVEGGLHKINHLHPISEIGVDIDGAEAEDPKNEADIEDYYKRMTEENPSDPLYLRKYAQFLYKTKGDLKGAEEYYSRVIVAYPQDGEILLEYAALLWELYHDQKTTLAYYERAIEAGPGDSDILAAYARFLWTIDDE
ncbi:uncharacterized protein LOC130826318 [Amaranthus tricolor]|uniref:uncharacterized protein LOC130826318 n=1 Tax=Amaranthus tricolor TaxID=29722 RepID=UPI00258E6D34|nr:uncharacterized protein LOC130826318 [Amaranthus tricolor]